MELPDKEEFDKSHSFIFQNTQMNDENSGMGLLPSEKRFFFPKGVNAFYLILIHSIIPLIPRRCLMTIL